LTGKRLNYCEMTNSSRKKKQREGKTPFQKERGIQFLAGETFEGSPRGNPRKSSLSVKGLHFSQKLDEVRLLICSVGIGSVRRGRKLKTRGGWGQGHPTSWILVSFVLLTTGLILGRLDSVSGGSTQGPLIPIKGGRFWGCRIIGTRLEGGG